MHNDVVHEKFCIFINGPAVETWTLFWAVPFDCDGGMHSTYYIL